MKINVHLTPKQLSALRLGKGINFKLTDGAHNVDIDDKKLVKLIKMKTKNKAIRLNANEISISPNEFKPSKRGKQPSPLSQSQPKINYEIQETSGGKINIAKSFRNMGRAMKKGFNNFGEDIADAERTVRKNKIARAVVKTVVPEIVKYGTMAGVTALTGNPMLGNIASAGTKVATSTALGQAGYGLIRDLNTQPAIFNPNDTGTFQKKQKQREIKEFNRIGQVLEDTKHIKGGSFATINGGSFQKIGGSCRNKN